MGINEAMDAVRNSMAIREANKEVTVAVENGTLAMAAAGPESDKIHVMSGDNVGIKNLGNGKLELDAIVSELGKTLKVTEMVDVTGNQTEAPKVTPIAEGVKMKLGERAP